MSQVVPARAATSPYQLLRVFPAGAISSSYDCLRIRLFASTQQRSGPSASLVMRAKLITLAPHSV
eukprot:6214769-Pleurochrysis_carterae.AAC.4